MARARTPATVLFPQGRFIMDPDEAQLRRDILLLERNISDYLKPLQASKELIIDDVKAAFETERDPVDGSFWPQLSERADRVARFGMLQRVKTNRRMYRAVTNKNSYGVTKRGVYLNTATVFRMAPYAGYHQQDDKLKAGKPSKISNDAVLAEMKRLQASGFGRLERTREASNRRIALQAIENVRENAKAQAEKLGAKMQGKIPQRRFIGPSEYSQGIILKVFDRWAKNAIIIYKRGGRTIVSKRRGL